MRIQLTLNDGKPLVHAEIPQIAFHPEFVFWQARLFQLQPDGTYREQFYIRINQGNGAGVPP